LIFFSLEWLSARPVDPETVERDDLDGDDNRSPESRMFHSAVAAERFAHSGTFQTDRSQNNKKSKKYWNSFHMLH
jgi:hypothetical protein